MILEQSFFALPEFLVGAGFTKYEAEGTLVMAYAMAALQELAGRGVNNPIQALRGEVNYPNLPNRAADIHLNYTSIGLLSPDLEHYGIRSDNWLEAKFFRKGQNKKPTVPKLVGTYSIFRDLLRLCVFPAEPELGKQPSPSKVSRYFLHVYEGSPSEHLAVDRNAKKKRVQRGWLGKLHDPGPQKLPEDDLTAEPVKTFTSQVGPNLMDVKMELDVTTLAIAPPDGQYSLYLTRIDGFKIARSNFTISVQNGQCSERSDGDWAKLRSAIDKDLGK